MKVPASKICTARFAVPGELNLGMVVAPIHSCVRKGAPVSCRAGNRRWCDQRRKDPRLLPIICGPVRLCPPGGASRGVGLFETFCPIVLTMDRPVLPTLFLRTTSGVLLSRRRTCGVLFGF